MRRCNLLSVLAVGVALAACSGGEPNPPPSTELPPETPPSVGTPVGIANNNSAVLSGEPLGSGDAEADLRTEVPVRLLTPTEGLELSPVAYVTRDTEDTETISWILPVTNVGEAARCFVEGVGYSFLDGAGDVLVEEDRTFAYGSVGVLPSSVYTDTCLDVGETGFFLGIELEDVESGAPLYSAVSALEFGALATGDEVPSAPEARVIPQSYQVSEDGVLGELLVSVQNEGDETVQLGTSRYILLDSSNTPLGWGFLSAAPDTSLPSGASATLSDPFFYQGLAEKLLVHVDFEGLTTVPLRVPNGRGLSRDERRHALLSLRTEQEAAKVEQALKTRR